MCYAIPGKIVDINKSIITVDYFGERKRARNEFFNLKLGEYIYAQGGIVVKTIPEHEAVDILDTWKEYFNKLKEKDLQLVQNPRTLYQLANSIRQKKLGNSCCVHGIIEFSNVCKQNCLYCGLRKSNTKLKRYRMSIDEIVKTCDYAVNQLGFKALVLQSGEDSWYTEKKLTELVTRIMEKCGILLVLSIGERNLSTFKKLYQLGARGILLRFETSNENLYKKMKPGSQFKKRIKLIKDLNHIGYLIFTGFLIGLPSQTKEDILRDIDFTGMLNAEMFSFGPFIPHPQTPFASEKRPKLDLILQTIAQARIKYPESKIVVTTALETLNKKDGTHLGLSTGGNSLMINVTPRQYQPLYELYPDRAGININTEERIQQMLDLLYSLGRAPTDLGL